jgi:hypothetical protein
MQLWQSRQPPCKASPLHRNSGGVSTAAAQLQRRRVHGIATPASSRPLQCSSGSANSRRAQLLRYIAAPAVSRLLQLAATAMQLRQRRRELHRSTNSHQQGLHWSTDESLQHHDRYITAPGSADKDASQHRKRRQALHRSSDASAELRVFGALTATDERCNAKRPPIVASLI